MWRPPMTKPVRLPSMEPPSLLKLENGHFVTPNGEIFYAPRFQGNMEIVNNGRREIESIRDVEKTSYHCLEKGTDGHYSNTLGQKESKRFGSSMLGLNQQSVGTSFLGEVLYSCTDTNSQHDYRSASQVDIVCGRSTETNVEGAFSMVHGISDCVKSETVGHRIEHCDVITKFKRTRIVAARRPIYKRVKKQKHPPGCLFCKDKEHSAQTCKVFPDVDSRIRFLNENRLCHNCAFKGHHADHCPVYNKKIGCRYCKSNHISLICKSQSEKSGQGSGASTLTVSNASLQKVGSFGGETQGIQRRSSSINNAF